jgi:FMN-dependent NADH-azoreductase
MGAVFSPEETRTKEQALIANQSDTLLEELKAADIIVIGMPVYNFGVPAQLKSWIDQIARKGETFRYTGNGPEGLLKGKRAIVAMSSDGTKMGSAADFASGYLRHVLGFIGITDVQFVAADAIAFDPDATLKAANAQIDALAA